MSNRLSQRVSWNRYAQLLAVLLCAAGLKYYYSAASVDQLRWILTPTTRLVEVVSGIRFAFESRSGYMSGDHTFLIAASCAGVNFLIAAFLLLSLQKLWAARLEKPGWGFIVVSAAGAYATTVIANTVRISTALLLRRHSFASSLNPEQLHRFEGILVYFGFLLLLFMISESVYRRSQVRSATRYSRQFLFPLSIYYLTTLGLPILNGAFRQGSGFWEHSAFVLVTPLIMIIPFVALSPKRQARACPTNADRYAKNQVQGTCPKTQAVLAPPAA